MIINTDRSTSFCGPDCPHLDLSRPYCTLFYRTLIPTHDHEDRITGMLTCAPCEYLTKALAESDSPTLTLTKTNAWRPHK